MHALKAKRALLALGLALLLAGVLFQRFHGSEPRTEALLEGETSFPKDFDDSLISKADLARAIGDSGRMSDLPHEVILNLEGDRKKAIVQYSFDPTLQAQIENLFNSYRPDYGAFVALHAESGRVLSMVSYTEKANAKKSGENFALRATFPSASIFKVVTAAAAIAEKKFTADTVLSFNGGNHTLYKSNVLKGGVNRWTRHITLKEAFGKSVNTVFGRIGAFTIGAEGLREYAGRFGFNRKIAADLPVQEGRAEIPDDSWGLAESASGFTRHTTMSPLQGALIAAAVANDGVMMEPYAVESVHDSDGELLYRAVPKMEKRTLDLKTASEIRELMRQTVASGTSRKSFRGFFKGALADLEVGGKTGSLTGTDPRGKYDWFVGYAGYGKDRIAIAALTISEKTWRVKSSHVARQAIQTYFSGH